MHPETARMIIGVMLGAVPGTCLFLFLLGLAGFESDPVANLFVVAAAAGVLGLWLAALTVRGRYVVVTSACLLLGLLAVFFPLYAVLNNLLSGQAATSPWVAVFLLGPTLVALRYLGGEVLRKIRRPTGRPERPRSR